VNGSVLMLNLAAATAIALSPQRALALPGTPIRLVYEEGDVAGFGTIYAPDGGTEIGFVEYRQTRDGDRLSCVRVAHFRDGSSDEDRAEARVAGRLEALGGRSIIRDTRGRPVVDLTIDVLGGRIHASWGDGRDQRTVDERADLSAGTYWGPLIFLVLKNFDANAVHGHLVFRTVAPTPRPRLLDLELVRAPSTALDRLGARLDVVPFTLRPTIHWAIDPLLHAFLPESRFFVQRGSPPALVLFAGPRNYAGQMIRIE